MLRTASLAGADTLSARGFAPDGLRGERLDRDVRIGLAHSLRTIFDTLEPAVDERRARGLLAAIEAGPVAARVFGAYVELVLALFDDRAGDARMLLDELLAARAPASDALTIVTLDDRELGAGQPDRYRRLLRDDVAHTLEALPVEARADAKAGLAAALDLLKAGAPDVYGEFRALVREVVLVTARDSEDGLVFGGASTFSLWGALVLNADRLGERLGAAVAVAHETAHSVLFGLAAGGRLVENDDDERYPSPLRLDRRPMEGVAHATFVTARMIYTQKALLASGQLDEGETAQAARSLERSLAAYAEGRATVLAHARFTPAGAAAFDAMRRHMDTSALS